MLKLRGAVLTCGAALLFFPFMCAAAQHPDSIRFAVDAPHTARVGDAVPITLRVTNTSNRGVTLYLIGRTVTFDIVVTGARGEVVWRRLEHKSTQQILQIKMLAAGETFELKGAWTATAPGEYSVQGVLPTDGEPLLTPEVRLRITPR